MAPKIAIVFYSMYGHIEEMAHAEAEGIRAAGGQVDLYRLPETLPEEVLGKMHAPPKNNKIPILSDPSTLTQYDGFLFGVPTRYGNFPSQWKIFWDMTGQIWMSGGLDKKYAGIFVSTATQGGGQEATVMAQMSTLASHGIVYVPLGSKYTLSQFSNMTEIHGGSPWGAGTFAGGDQSRRPTELEKDIARIQGETFYKRVARIA